MQGADGEQPQDGGEQPQDAGEQPQDAGEQPQDTGEQPQDGGEQAGVRGDGQGGAGRFQREWRSAGGERVRVAAVQGVQDAQAGQAVHVQKVCLFRMKYNTASSEYVVRWFFENIVLDPFAHIK